MTPFPTLTTERFALTPLTVADAEAMAVVLADPSMHAFTGGSPPTVEGLRERYRYLVVGRSPDGSERWCNWVVRPHGDPEVLGAMQATVWVDQARVAWEVGVAWQRRGVASEAAGAVVAWLRAEGITLVEAAIHADHIASQRVAARIGLRATSELDDGEVVWRLPGG